MKVFALLMLVSGAALADDNAMRACRTLGAPAARVACYDAIPLGVPPSAAAPAPAPAPRMTAEQSFGMAPAAKAAEAPVQSIESTIVGNFDGWGPNARIRLANGQVWRVVDGSEAVLTRMSNPKVKVVRNFIGTMFMQIEGTNNSPKVKRVE